MGKHNFTLYIAGQSEKSLKAVENINRFCIDNYQDSFNLKVIDIVKEPEKAETDGIIATPCLRKKSPPPTITFIGDVSDKFSLAKHLGIDWK